MNDVQFSAEIADLIGVDAEALVGPVGYLSQVLDPRNLVLPMADGDSRGAPNAQALTTKFG